MGTKKRQKRRVFTEEFKRDSVNLIVVEGYSFKSASDAVNVNENSLRRWHKKYAPEPEPCGEENKFDFCRLPYPDDSFDVVVFDPPYVQKHSVSSDLQSYSARINRRYGLATGTESYGDILLNYEDGMAEGCRVLRRGGLLLVKCANFCDSTQRWLNEDVFQIANRLGFYKVDEFVLLRQSDPVANGQTQSIARKNHNYLQVFQAGKRKPK